MKASLALAMKRAFGTMKASLALAMKGERWFALTF